MRPPHYVPLNPAPRKDFAFPDPDKCFQIVSDLASTTVFPHDLPRRDSGLFRGIHAGGFARVIVGRF